MEEIVIFQIFIKWPEINIFGHYIAQNVRNDQKNPKMDVTSHVSYRKYENLKKKTQGYKIQQKKFLSLLVFCHFWSNCYLYDSKFFTKKNLYIFLFFWAYQRFYSSKIKKTRTKQHVPFFFPSTVFNYFVKELI